MPHYQTLNPNRDSNRVSFNRIDSVHWGASTISEHHIAAGGSTSQKVQRGKGAAAAAAAASAASGGAAASAVSAVSAVSHGGTLTTKYKISPL